MTHSLLSPRARADLDDIWDYSAGRWGVEQAESYIRGIAAAVATVAAHPKAGRACDEIRRGYRKYSAGSHVIYYRPVRAQVVVVRILHQRMDPDLHL